MKKRKIIKRSKKFRLPIVFLIVGFGILSYFGLNFFTPPSPHVLGTENKQIKSINISGKEYDYKKGYLDFELPGVEGTPNFYSVPVTITYGDGSSKKVFLGFKYLQ